MVKRYSTWCEFDRPPKKWGNLLRNFAPLITYPRPRRQRRARGGSGLTLANYWRAKEMRQDFNFARQLLDNYHFGPVVLAFWYGSNRGFTLPHSFGPRPLTGEARKTWQVCFNNNILTKMILFTFSKLKLRFNFNTKMIPKIWYLIALIIGS